MEDQKKSQTENSAGECKDSKPDAAVSPAVPAAVPAAGAYPPGSHNNVNPYYKPYIPRNKTQEYQSLKSKVISQKGFIITVLSILLATLFTETIFLGTAGISVPIFAIVFYSSLFYYFHENEKPINRTGIFLTIPVFLLAFSFFLHYNPSTQFITWLTLIGLVCIQLVMLGTNPAESLFSYDMLTRVMSKIIGHSFLNLGMPFFSLEFLKKRKTRHSGNAILILIGLAISLPVVIILMGLFMSADAVFENAVNSFIGFIGLDFGNIFADLFLGFFGGLFLAAALLSLKYEEQEKKAAEKIGNSIDGLVIGTFLTIINILLIAFVGFQFAYLFGGTVNIAVSDMTYAEYARRGFFELTAASGIIFSISLFVMIMTKKKEDKLPSWVKLCTVSLCLCNGVLLVSAIKRMLLYVDVYGLSVKRMLTLWLMCLIGLCLVWMIIKCFMPKMDVMKLIGITVVTGVCILSLTNTERLIARYNIDRYISDPTKITLDVYHLGRLSFTAAPEIARLKDMDSDGSQFVKSDIIEILQKQKASCKIRNTLYGFTLDSIEVQKVFSGMAK